MNGRRGVVIRSMARSAQNHRAYTGFTLALVASLLLAVPLSGTEAERTRKTATTESETSARAEAARERSAGDAEQRQESPLVRAAREASRATGTRKFTDEDLKHAKGRLIVIEGSNVQPVEVESVEQRLARLRRQEQSSEPQAPSRQSQIAALEQTILDLEEQLLEIEDGYYLGDEDFERYVDDSRFAIKRAELERAKRDLARLKSPSTE
jgi:hypothetical protein